MNFRGVPQADPDNVISLPGYQNRGSENNVFVATGVGIEARTLYRQGRVATSMLRVSPWPIDDQMSLY